MRDVSQGGICIVHYWGGQPKVRTSRFDWHHAILERCRQKGWRSVIVFSEEPQNSDIREALAESQIECVYVDRPRCQFSAYGIRDACDLFRKVGCTIAHLHCVHTSPIIGAAMARVPIRIWSVHSSEYRDDGKKLGALHRLGLSTRVTCALAYKVLPVSESIRRELLHHGISDRRMCVAPVPIQLERYRRRRETRHAIRASLGIEDGEIAVCTVGQGIYRKGWDVLIQAFAAASGELRNMRLLLIGAMTSRMNGEPDAYQKSLLRLVSKLNLQNHVQFLGIREDVGALLSASDIFAFPSRGEALGLGLLEAMAAGIPCVASHVGGIPEFITDGENGLLVKTEDVGSLAKALGRLAGDEPLRQKLGERAASSIESYSLTYQVERVVNLYEELLSARGLMEAREAHDK